MSPPPTNGLRKLIVQEGVGSGKVLDLDKVDESEETAVLGSLALAAVEPVENIDVPLYHDKKESVVCCPTDDIKECTESKLKDELHYKDGSGGKLGHMDLSHDYYRVNNCLDEADSGNQSLPEKTSFEQTTKVAKRKQNYSFKQCKKKRLKVALRTVYKAGTSPHQNTLAKTVMGNTTEASGGTTTVKCHTSTPSGGKSVVRRLRSGGGGGGGDGDGDGDGDDQDKRYKKPSHYIPYENVAVKENKAKKKNEEVGSDRSASSEMQVDGSSSSKMEVDCITPPKNLSTSDVNMKSVQPVKSEVGVRPDEKSQETPRQQVNPHVNKNMLIYLNNRLNHRSVRKKPCCLVCQKVDEMLDHYKWGEGSHCSSDCKDCATIKLVLQFHLQMCKRVHCSLCQTINANLKTQRSTSGNMAVRAPNRFPNVLASSVQVLNVPTAQSSLDQNEEVLYKDAMFGSSITHLREHQDYTCDNNVIGKGGNGSVYNFLFHDHLKIRYPDLFNKKFVCKKVGKLSQDELAAYKTITHPNFVETYFVVKKDGGYRIIMEKYDGSLHDYLNALSKEGKTMDLYEAMHFWTQVLDSVAYLHSLKIPIIHKDIKAQNVMLTRLTNFARAKLGDFDAVKLLHHEYTNPGLQPQGTLYFIAPEVKGRHVHGRPADIYSLGVFLLQLMCRRYLDNTELAIQELKKIDNDVGEMVEQCIKENPDARPTAAQLQKHEIVRRFSERRAR